MGMLDRLFPAGILDVAGMGSAMRADPFLWFLHRREEFSAGIVFDGMMKRNLLRFTTRS